MHDVAVALDEELVGDLDRPDLGDAADIVAAEVEQHQVLGAFLGIGEQLLLQRLVFLRGRAAPARAGDRADGDLAVAGLDQDLGARSGDGEGAEIEEEQIRRGVEAPQRAVERERRQRERRLEALRRHDLKNIAGADVVLGALDHAPEFFRRRVRARRRRPLLPFDRERGRAHDLRFRFVERLVEGIDDAGEPFDRARECRLGGHACLRPHRRDDGDRVLDRVEGDDEGGPDEDRVRNADRIGTGRRQVLHQPHHVVAEIAEDARGHRRQRLGQCDAALGDEAAQCVQRPVVGRRKGVRIALRPCG